jgi:AraC-like DNA-binding protein
MKFDTYLPCDRLKPYIKHFIISENGDAQTYKVLPDTALVMGFQYAGQLAHVKEHSAIPLATAGITGLLDTYRIFENTANTCTVLVIFKETGAAGFLKHPVHELFNESLSLGHFFSRAELSETEEKLALANEDRQRISIIEQLLIRHLYNQSEDLLVVKAISYIKQNQGTVRIAELARDLNISQSPLEKRFRKIVGSSPKKFASIVRVKNVMAALKHHNYQEAIFLSGYYDQAHLIRDFKTFTGITPEQYVKSLK